LQAVVTQRAFFIDVSKDGDLTDYLMPHGSPEMPEIPEMPVPAEGKGDCNTDSNASASASASAGASAGASASAAGTIDWRISALRQGLARTATVGTRVAAAYTKKEGREDQEEWQDAQGWVTHNSNDADDADAAGDGDGDGEGDSDGDAEEFINTCLGGVGIAQLHMRVAGARADDR
jgi:hypothetical protein